MSTGFGPAPDHPQQGQQPGDPQQPGYPSPAYGAAGYQPAAYQPGAGTDRNPAGRAALAAGIVVVVLSLLQQTGTYLIPMLWHANSMRSFDAYQVFAYISTGVIAVSGLVALILGIIGLQAAGKPKGAAGAGCAVGVWALVSSMMGVALPLIANGSL